METGGGGDRRAPSVGVYLEPCTTAKFINPAETTNAFCARRINAHDIDGSGLDQPLVAAYRPLALPGRNGNGNPAFQLAVAFNIGWIERLLNPSDAVFMHARDRADGGFQVPAHPVPSIYQKFDRRAEP